ncbi:MAG TPA: hypothetical protein VN783_05085, partial [Thermoanaerobaculia bacterium]|nr:hypothetical protein [Thermoanaerobaculia bacterium]
MQLKKATLQEISSDQQGQPVGDPVEVQFNPTTLHLTISNQVEGGDTRGRQARQYIGSSSTVLTCDLVFDTADEGTTDSPRSVREKTAIVERFVLPKEDGKEAPPKLRFHWGELILDGVVNSVSIDFDHFAADGTPLRAKVALSLQEQNAKYQFLEAGPGANRQGNAPAPGALSLGAVGGASLGLSAGLSIGASAGLSVGLSAGLGAQASLALDGESAAEFAARVGVDPSAWRGLDADLSGGLSLGAGAEVAFSADLSASLGPGAGAGFAAGSSGSLQSSFGLDAQGAVAGGGGAAAAVLAERQAGFAL